MKYGLLQKYYSTLNSGARKSFVDNVWDKVVSPFENYFKFVDKDDVKELVIEYADQLR